MLRHLEEVPASPLDTLLDRERNLVRLAVADPDPRLLVTHHDERGEREAPAALDDLGHPVDLDDPLLELRLGGIVPARATAVVAGRAVALSTLAPARGTSHRAASSSAVQKSNPPSRAASASAWTRPWNLYPPRSNTTAETPACLARRASSLPTRLASSRLLPSPGRATEGAAASVRPAPSSMIWA